MIIDEMVADRDQLPEQGSHDTGKAHQLDIRSTRKAQLGSKEVSPTASLC